MLNQLTADEFVHVNPASGEETPGRTVISEFGFDLDFCKITASDSGVLCVKQEGFLTFICDRPFWRRVPLAG